MKTIAEVETLIQENANKRNTLSAEIEELEKTAAAIEADVQAAAKSDDVDAYLAKKSEKDRIDALLYVKRSALNNIPDVLPVEEVSDAWAAYADTYNKALRKKMKAYTELRQKLSDAFIEMVNLQLEACTTREKLAKYTGNTVEFLNPCIVDKVFAMDYMPCDETSMSLHGTPWRISDPDTLYYLAGVESDARKLFESEIAKKIISVVKFHRSFFRPF